MHPADLIVLEDKFNRLNKIYGILIKKEQYLVKIWIPKLDYNFSFKGRFKDQKNLCMAFNLIGYKIHQPNLMDLSKDLVDEFLNKSLLTHPIPEVRQFAKNKILCG